MLSGNSFGEAGHKVVMRSAAPVRKPVLSSADGGILPMASSQDHKAAEDSDAGPNTGGMGAYFPAPVVTPAMHDRIMDEVILPTVTGMAQEGLPYTGFLYAGVMINTEGVPKVLEFNCRFGDPETQPIMLRMKSDLVAHCLAAVDGTLDTQQADWDQRASLGVVLAAGGYPGSYRTGDVISGHPGTNSGHQGISRWHCRERRPGGHCGTGSMRHRAGRYRHRSPQGAYALVRQISWDGMYYRNDIGYRAIAREQD